ncbi:MAG: PQQ-binding-like beta-propeller repeat protein [Bryobacterales bacterium]|nr:PQQ-binding-like beta-propeller repeat protein [Bryobacterales bacterium]
MTSKDGEASALGRPLRLWPGVAIITVQWLLRFVLPVLMPEAMVAGILGALAGGLLVVLWWAFLSRARVAERIGAMALMAAGFASAWRGVDVSLATGAQGMLYPLLAVPVVSLAFVAWAVATRNVTGPWRWVTMAAAIFASTGVWTLVRTGGLSGNFDNDLSWRWTESAEERLLAQPVEPVAAAGATPAAGPVTVPAPAPLAAAAPKAARYWPGFRGAERDGVVRGARIEREWNVSPPVEMWRRAVGPGWSSVAVSGELLYTQEQRGEEEVVSCYRVESGKPVWMHKDAARFWESNAGAGPRGTPTLHNGRVYTLGATGIVNALDARTGAVVWARNAAEDTGAKRPDWGFSGSPLVAGEVLVVAASGNLIGYELATGNPRWKGPESGASYSSPKLAMIDGVLQVLLLSAKGVTSVSPADGATLWLHAWKGYPIVQPGVTEDGDVLISASESSGTRRLTAKHGQEGWTVEERWTSNALKPYFNDYVIHKGNAYGFDGSILACMNLADGKRKWKGGRYGQGQLVLLADMDLLLVLSEEGELALVQAKDDQFTEVARRPGISGKTWNHPAVAGDVLLVRNGEEMAAFRLPAANGGESQK